MRATYITLLSLYTSSMSLAQTAESYWKLEGNFNDMMPAANHLFLIPGGVSGSFETSDPVVGGYYEMPDYGPKLANSTFTSTGTQRTLEFMFRPNDLVERAWIILSGVDVRFDQTGIVIRTRTTGVGGGTTSGFFPFVGSDRRSFEYYIDGNWHHIALVSDISTAEMTLYIDGITLPEFTVPLTSPGTAFNGGIPFRINLSGGDEDYELNGGIDEIAGYTTALPPTLIYQHYLEAMSGSHYTFVDVTDPGDIPASPITDGPLTLDEYSPNVDVLQQMYTYKVPRFMPNHDLGQNTSFLQNNYLVDESHPDFYSRATDLNWELAHNFNYHISIDRIGGRTYPRAHADPPELDPYTSTIVNFANMHPEYPLFVKTVWSKINPQETYSPTDIPTYGYDVSLPHCSPSNTSLAAILPTEEIHLQDDFDNYLPAFGNRYLSPAGIFRDLAYYDGNGVFYKQVNPIAHHLTRNIDMIVENNEVVHPHLGDQYEIQVEEDADCVAELPMSYTFEDVENYIGMFKGKLNKKYFEGISNGLSGYTYMTGTDMLAYHVTDFDNEEFKYEGARIGQATINGQYYPTPVVYPQGPGRWKTKMGPYGGMETMLNGREVEIPLGDKLFSPFVMSGWNTNDELNIRPGQWLGMLKLMGASGADFYHVFHETKNIPHGHNQDSEDFIWQSVMPSYAQGVSSRYEEFLHDGYLLEGNGTERIQGVGTVVEQNNLPYDFASNRPLDNIPNDPNMITLIRRKNSEQKYLISTTIQRLANVDGISSYAKDNTIKLGDDLGYGEFIRFESRLQGATYIYDLTGPSPVFYQLDKWHEHIHPFLWSDVFAFESEVYNNGPTETSGFKRVTEGIDYSSGVTDFTPSTTYLEFLYNQGFDNSPVTHANALLAAAHYDFQPRPNPGHTNYKLKVRFRSYMSPSPAAKIMVFLDDVFVGDIDASGAGWEEEEINLPGLTVDRFTKYKVSLVPRHKSINLDRFDIYPVTMLIASPLDEKIEVKWNEPVIQGTYILERSTDGIEFSELAAVSKQQNDYLDQDVKKGQQYVYRLKVTNTEGETSFTNISSAKIDVATTISLHPNPAKTKCNVQVHAQEGDQDAQITLYNLQGQKLNSKPFPVLKGENSTELLIDGLSSGPYIVTFKSQETVKSEMLIIL